MLQKDRPAPVVLAPKYYLNYFTNFLSHVKKFYGPLLLPAEEQFLVSFDSLSEDARCLYVRMATRRGNLFTAANLGYVELKTPLPVLVAELLEKKWIRPLSALDAPPELLDFYTRRTWLDLARECQLPHKKSDSKAQLLETARASHSRAELCAVLLRAGAVYQRQRDDTLELFKFLYFGNLRGDFSAFILRDIGRSRYEERSEDALTARFDSRAVLDECYGMAQGYEDFKKNGTAASVTEMLASFSAWQGRLRNQGREASAEGQRTIQKWALGLARLLEKTGRLAEALAVYRCSQRPPTHERQIRILKKLGRKQEAHELCIRVAENPHADSHELAFARDELQRAEAALTKTKALRSTTAKMRSAECLLLADYQSGPEAAAIAHYESRGYHALYTENYIWNSLFGILFWELIHSKESRYHFPLQVLPTQLHAHHFFQDNRAAAQLILEPLAAPELFRARIDRTLREKFGTVNRFVSWNEKLASELCLLHRLVGWEKLRAVLEEIMLNPKEKAKGFPDLLVYRDREYFFVEVKSQRDKLSSYQVRWLNFFEENKIPAKILKFKRSP